MGRILLGCWLICVLGLRGDESFGAPTGTPSGTFNSEALGINNYGEVTGYFFDSRQRPHGYIRHADGLFELFDCSEGETVYFTMPHAINSAGQVAGFVVLSQAPYARGFVRDPGGACRFIDYEGYATYVRAINDSGAVAGYVVSDEFPFARAFTSDADGNMAVFEFPAAEETVIAAINNAGQTAGWYRPTLQSAARGFIREADGALATFEIAGEFLDSETQPMGLNSAGEVSGYAAHGINFIRGVGGSISTYDPAAFAFAVFAGINDQKQVTGICSPPQYRGFIFTVN